MGVMSYAYRFATPENDWEALLFRHLPPWLVIADAGLVKDFYEGEVGFFSGGYWRRWAVPILSWSVVVLLLIAMFFCLTIIIRKQWVENEKLAYPIIRIPLEVSTRSGRHLWQSTPMDGFRILPRASMRSTVLSISSRRCPRFQ